jgi:primosomal protein N'
MSALAVRPRWVEVAVDSAGPGGGQMYTYHLPEALADIAPGEAVLVEYGRRNALGVVLALAEGEPERDTKPVVARVRSDGPLMPELQLRLAAHIARHYLAPAALVVRAMLAPDALERLERVTVSGVNGPTTEWRLRQRDDHRRLERLARLGEVAPASRLGVRQQAVLAELRRREGTAAGDGAGAAATVTARCVRWSSRAPLSSRRAKSRAARWPNDRLPSAERCPKAAS